MKIIKLTLTNFSRVLSGLGKTKVTLDLLNTHNAINLFVGINGTGKTSIMRCLHPFAYNSSIGDASVNADLIIKGCDGKKEIRFLMDDGVVYDITHIYTRKKDGTLNTKSYISKNNEEMNENGTATLFKDVVKQEMGIDETFLTLLSIGNSVKGFVDFTSGDRKKFASKIFSDLGIYDKHFKTMTNNARVMKSLLNNVTSKLSKYSDVNYEDLKYQLEGIEKNLKEIQIKKSSVLQSIGGIQNQLTQNQSSIEKYNALQSQLVQKLDEFQPYKIYMSYDKSNLDKELSSYLDQLNSIKTEIEVNRSKIQSSLDLSNSKLTSIHMIQDNISKMDSGEDIYELDRVRANILSSLSAINYVGLKEKLNISKDELIKSSIYLDELVNLCNRFIFEVSDENIIPEVVDNYKKTKNLYNKLVDKFNQLGDQVQQFNLVNQTRLVGDHMIQNGSCSDKNCPYKKFYENYMKVINQSIEDTDKEIRNKKKELSYIEDCMKVTAIVEAIFKYINTNKNHLSKLPGDLFNLDTFIDSYLDNRTVYNKDRMTVYIDTLEKDEKYLEYQSQLEDLDKRIGAYRKTESIITDMKKSVEDMEQELSQLGLDQENHSKKLSELNFDQICMEDTIEEVRTKISNLEKAKDIQSDITFLGDKMRPMEDQMRDINSLQDKLKLYQGQQSDLDLKIVQLEDMKQRTIHILTDMETLQKEELELREKYDDIIAIRDAVSPTKGIPVDFISYYVKVEMIDKINQLLEPVYHGKLELLGGDNVIIDEDNFTLPYRKYNTIVDDISKASDGERAMLGIIISLVLSELSLDLDRYNVMLWDEVDTSFDHYARGKFLDLAEAFMKIIKAKQLFMISHSNMFDSYPVTVFMTSEMNISNMSQAERIELYN